MSFCHPSFSSGGHAEGFLVVAALFLAPADGPIPLAALRAAVVAKARNEQFLGCVLGDGNRALCVGVWSLGAKRWGLHLLDSDCEPLGPPISPYSMAADAIRRSGIPPYEPEMKCDSTTWVIGRCAYGLCYPVGP